MNTDEFMRVLARGINGSLHDFLGDGFGFALIVFKFNANPTDANFISNADREDMIRTLRETADRIERNAYMPATMKGVH